MGREKAVRVACAHDRACFQKRNPSTYLYAIKIQTRMF